MFKYLKNKKWSWIFFVFFFNYDNNTNALVMNDANKEVGIITKEKVIDILINRNNKN